jgi:hypothetical protein
MSEIIQSFPLKYVSATGTVNQLGAANSDFVYSSATITLDPGVWLVQGQASIFVTTASPDDVGAGLYNNTLGAEIANSRGPCVTANSGLAQEVMTRLVKITATSSTNIRVLCARSGVNASTIQALVGPNLATSPAVALWGQKIG